MAAVPAQQQGPPQSQQAPQARVQFQRLAELRPSSRPVHTKFIVLEKGQVKSSNNDSPPVCLCLVADASASVHFQFYGNEVREVEIEHVIEWTQLIGTVTLSETHRE